MRKRHTAEQIAQAVRQAEAGTPLAEIIRKFEFMKIRFISGKRNMAV
jgi:hypothetical protein